MITKDRETLLPFFLSWNLRNLTYKTFYQAPGDFGLIEAYAGKYPIDDWEPHFFEMPKTGYKKDITGRMNKAVPRKQDASNSNRRRIVSLPNYVNAENADISHLKLIVKYWRELQMPDEVPVLAIAVKCHGNYCEIREAKQIQTLLVWNDRTCRITTLEWFEGPEEDCITPEWYVSNSGLLNLERAVNVIIKNCSRSNWKDPVYSIFPLPQNLGSELSGERASSAYDQWDLELRYFEHSVMMKDLLRLFSKINWIFSTEEVC